MQHRYIGSLECSLPIQGLDVGSALAYGRRQKVGFKSIPIALGTNDNTATGVRSRPHIGFSGKGGQAKPRATKSAISDYNSIASSQAELINCQHKRPPQQQRHRPTNEALVIVIKSKLAEQQPGNHKQETSTLGHHEQQQTPQRPDSFATTKQSATAPRKQQTQKAISENSITGIGNLLPTKGPAYSKEGCSGCQAASLPEHREAHIGRPQRAERFIIPPKPEGIKLEYTASEAADEKSSSSRDYESTYYSYHHQKPDSFEHTASLEPQPDDKCPMTGHLTICDQIGSYPVNVILHKLDSAKRALKRSYFNLDSFFSDERDHSSDPFEDESQIGGSGGSSANEQSVQAHPHLEGNLNNDNNFSYSNNTDSHHGAYAKEANYAPPKLDYHTVRGGSDYLEPVSKDEATSSQHAQATDEFVNLVEQRAVRISNGNIGSAPAAANAEASGAADAGDQYRTNRYYGLGHHLGPQKQHQMRGKVLKRPPPIMVSGRALADRLISMSKSLSLQQADADTADHSYQSYQVALSAAASTPTATTNFKHSTSANTSANSASKARRLKRPRRQVAVGVASASGGEGQQEPGTTGPGGERGLAVNMDPERVAEAANMGQPPPEPVCRAKSIYISPRVALNDKKQWKYVVNAPERNPQIRQIIRVDICEDPLGPCSDQVSLPFGFTSQCKQKYAKKKLLALDPQLGLLEVDTFFIPSCCVCQLVRDPQPSETNTLPADEAATNRPDDSNSETTNGNPPSSEPAEPLQGDSSSPENSGSGLPETNPEAARVATEDLDEGASLGSRKAEPEPVVGGGQADGASSGNR